MRWRKASITAICRAKLPRSAEKGYAGIIQNFIKDDGQGSWSLTNCCSVAGLGFKNAAGRARDGSFDYYISEPVVKNDLKGVGPFILAGIEMEKMTDITFKIQRHIELPPVIWFGIA